MGFAELVLPSGRRASVVDVPGHERLVKTMVAGATGIDFFLLVVAADDGVMPQTIEHVTVLRAVGVELGVVAITKIDLDTAQAPSSVAPEIAELLPDTPLVGVSRTDWRRFARLADGARKRSAFGGRIASATRRRANSSRRSELYASRHRDGCNRHAPTRPPGEGRESHCVPRGKARAGALDTGPWKRRLTGCSWATSRP